MQEKENFNFFSPDASNPNPLKTKMSAPQSDKNSQNLNFDKFAKVKNLNLINSKKEALDYSLYQNDPLAQTASFQPFSYENNLAQGKTKSQTIIRKLEPTILKNESTEMENNFNLNVNSNQMPSSEEYNTEQNADIINNADLVEEINEKNASATSSDRNDYITNNDLVNIALDMDSNLNKNNNNEGFNFENNIGNDALLSELGGIGAQENNNEKLNISEYPSTNIKLQNNQPISAVQTNAPLTENFSDFANYFENDFNTEIKENSSPIQNEISDLVENPPNAQVQMVQNTPTPLFEKELTSTRIEPMTSMTEFDSIQNIPISLSKKKVTTKDSSTQTQIQGININLTPSFESSESVGQYLNIDNNPTQYDDIFNLIEQNSQNQTQSPIPQEPISTNTIPVVTQSNDINIPQSDPLTNNAETLTQTYTNEIQLEAQQQNQNINIPMTPVTTSYTIEIETQNQAQNINLDKAFTFSDNSFPKEESTNINEDIASLEANDLVEYTTQPTSSLPTVETPINDILKDLPPLETNNLTTYTENIAPQVNTEQTDILKTIQPVETNNLVTYTSNEFPQANSELSDILKNLQPLETNNLTTYSSNQVTSVNTELTDTEKMNQILDNLPPLQANDLLGDLKQLTSNNNILPAAQSPINTFSSNVIPEITTNITQPISTVSTQLPINETHIETIPSNIKTLSVENLSTYEAQPNSIVNSPLSFTETVTETIPSNINTLPVENLTTYEAQPNSIVNSPLSFTETVTETIPSNINTLPVENLTTYETQPNPTVSTPLSITETAKETIPSNINTLPVENLTTYESQPNPIVSTPLSITETAKETIPSNINTLPVENLTTYESQPNPIVSTPLSITETAKETIPSNINTLPVENLTTYESQPNPIVSTPLSITETAKETIPSNINTLPVENLTTYESQPNPIVSTPLSFKETIPETIPSNIKTVSNEDIITYEAQSVPTINSKIDIPQSITSTPIESIPTNNFPLQSQTQNQEFLSNTFSQIDSTLPITQTSVPTIPPNKYFTQPVKTIQTYSPLPIVENQFTSFNSNNTPFEIKSLPSNFTPSVNTNNIPIVSIIYPTENQHQPYLSQSTPLINIQTNSAQNQIASFPKASIPLETQNQNSFISQTVNPPLPLTRNSIISTQTSIPQIETQNIYIPPLPPVQNTQNTFENQITNISTNIFPLESQKQNIYIPPPPAPSTLNTSSSYVPFPIIGSTTNVSSYGVENQSNYLLQPYTTPIPQPQNQISASSALPYEIPQQNQISQSFIYTQQPYSTYPTTQSTNMPNKMRTETEIVPVEEVEYVPVKKLKYVKKTKVYVPKVQKVIIPVKKNVVVPVKKTIYVPKKIVVPINSSGQFTQNSYVPNYSQIQSPQNYSSMSNKISNLDTNNLPYNVNTTHTEVDNEMEEHAIPLYEKDSTKIQYGSSLNPMAASFSSFNFGAFSSQRSVSPDGRQSLIHSGKIYNPVTYRARSLSSRRHF